MRILMVHPGPDFSVSDVFAGWYKALRKLGHEVMVYNTNDRLTFYGQAHLEDFSRWKDQDTRNQPKCASCGQPPYRRALNDNEVCTLTTKGLFEATYLFWPDVVFFVSAFFFTAPTFQVLRTRGHKIVMLHTESPYEDKEQMKRGQFADLNLINDPVNLQAWQDLGPTVRYMPHAYDPDIHFAAPHPREYEEDLAFVGTGFKSRRDFFGKFLATDHRQMDFRATLGGGCWGDAMEEPENRHLLDYVGHNPENCVDNDEAARIYRLSKMGINFYRREGGENWGDEGWAIGPREVEMAACELFFLRDPRPESDELFGDILPSFDSPEAAYELAKYWSDPSRDSRREYLAGQARDRIADRTFDNHAKYAMELMELASIC